MKSPYLVLAATGLLGLALLAGPPRGIPAAAAATPPPTPPPIDTPSTPQPNASLFPPAVTPLPSPLGTGLQLPESAKGKPSATPSPPPNARKGLEGVWEVQIQDDNQTNYTHFKLQQTGNTITGTYLNAAGKRFPLAGSVDGQAIRLIVSMPDGTTMLMEGRLDGTTDMVGMLTTPKKQIPFTASYRPKEKWIENVNPAPGGFGQPSGGYIPP